MPDISKGINLSLSLHERPLPRARVFCVTISPLVVNVLWPGECVTQVIYEVHTFFCYLSRSKTRCRGNALPLSLRPPPNGRLPVRMRLQMGIWPRHPLKVKLSLAASYNFPINLKSAKHELVRSKFRLPIFNI